MSFLMLVAIIIGGLLIIGLCFLVLLFDVSCCPRPRSRGRYNQYRR